MEKYIFDNSNLAESYSGVTTPLTYSFARYIYQEVYKHFCQMMGVSRKTIAQNEKMFSQMLEFIGYRMYYNLINWYKLVSFLPGYKFNKGFFEKMLGVQKGYDQEILEKKSFIKKYFIYMPRLFFQTIKILITFCFMGVLVKKFNNRFDKTLEEKNKIDLDRLNLKELKDLYFQLDKKLISFWRIPIANDFAVMVSTGVAEKLLKNNLYLNMRSSLSFLDPNLKIAEIVKLVKEDKFLFKLFTEKEDSNYILQQLQKVDFQKKASKLIFEYIDKFGSRSPNELKLESESFNENPSFFISLIRTLVINKKSDKELVSNTKDIHRRNSFIATQFINWATSSIRQREETRFKRTLIFGFTRKIFLAIGRKLNKESILNDQKDIFYLTVEEIFDCIEKGDKNDQLKKIVAERKEEFLFWKNIDMSQRIESGKPISDIEKDLIKAQTERSDTNVSTNTLKGMVVSNAGVDRIRGSAVVILEFDSSINFDGKILVTQHTDPGWTIIFPLLKGLVVEKGGMLSHAAIVARELNIPCIIGVEGATKIIKNNTIVELDLNGGGVYNV